MVNSGFTVASAFHLTTPHRGRGRACPGRLLQPKSPACTGDDYVEHQALETGRYGRAACCCSTRIALNMASSTSASSVQLVGSTNGLAPPSFSLAYFSCMLYWAP